MDKNAALLVRSDLTTVVVAFGTHTLDDFTEPKAHAYTYVTDLKLARGDLVLVMAAAGGVKIAVGTVLEAHDTCRIEPNSETLYQFIVQRVDLTAWQENNRKRAEIEIVLNEEYQRRARQSYRQVLMESLDDAGRTRLKLALGEAQ